MNATADARLFVSAYLAVPYAHLPDELASVLEAANAPRKKLGSFMLLQTLAIGWRSCESLGD